MDELKSIDLGCGAKKQPGYIGIDGLAIEGVDLVVDLDRQPLPLADESVGAVFSSHCIEHLTDVEGIFREISRVCAHGARVELWHPYSAHNDAYLLGHLTALNETSYVHLSSLAPAYWAQRLGARWIVKELVFAIPGELLAQLEAQGISVEFAVRHLYNVVTELGVIVEIDKRGPFPETAPPPPQVFAVSRSPADRRPLAAATAATPSALPSSRVAPEAAQARELEPDLATRLVTRYPRLDRVTRLSVALLERLARR